MTVVTEGRSYSVRWRWKIKREQSRKQFHGVGANEARTRCSGGWQVIVQTGESLAANRCAFVNPSFEPVTLTETLVSDYQICLLLFTIGLYIFGNASKTK